MATNRRQALRNAFMFLGAAVGIGAASKNLTAAQLDDSPPEANPSPGKKLVIEARRLRISSQDIRRGELPRAGVRMTARAEIVSASSKNKKVGEFLATYHRVSNPGKAAAHEPGSLEHHTFILPEGTIFGTGVSTAGTEGEGQFAILGGTGRYHGARGSYTARQSHVDFGGNGAATFTLTLI